MPLEHGGRHRIGFLEIDAPVFQFVERDPHVRYGAAHIGSGRHHAEIAIQILHLRFAMPRGTKLVQHRLTLRSAGPQWAPTKVYFLSSTYHKKGGLSAPESYRLVMIFP